MRKLIVYVALMSLSCAFAAQDKGRGVENDNARMSSDNGDGTFTNPVIHADYPDPDIIRVGEDYYLVSSSFVCMPGIPICHSKDLINWKIIGHAYDSINFQPQYRMEGGKTAYSRICWAPSFKYKDGVYYIGVNIKDDGFVMYKSDRPEGPYKMYKYNKTLYDPGFFIDDDGKKYVTHGKTKIYLTRVKDDATGVDSDAEDKLIIKAPEGYGHLFEGCHMYKRNGYYYIFNPALGYDGVQMISRSKNIYGPYETKVLIKDDINYAGAGVHQGGYVETQNGESWAFTFQDRDYMGRDLMLYPMRWVDDWPVVGPEGKPGKGVVTYRKPNLPVQPLSFPQHSDDFSSEELSLVWEFNHVPVKDKWSLTERSGYLRLHSIPAAGFYWARNSLTQKASGPSSTVTVALDLKGLQKGDFAGTGIMGSNLFQLGVLRTTQGDSLQLRAGYREKPEVAKVALAIGKKNKQGVMQADRVYLRVEVTRRGTLLFSYSLNGKQFNRFGGEEESGFWGFLGIRHTLCHYNLDGTNGGYADFDSFLLTSKVRGNHYDAFDTVDFTQYDDREGMRLVRIQGKRPAQYITEMKAGDWLRFNNLEFGKKPRQMQVLSTGEGRITLREGRKNGKVLATLTLDASGERLWQTINLDAASSKALKAKKATPLYFVVESSEDNFEIQSFRFIK